MVTSVILDEIKNWTPKEVELRYTSPSDRPYLRFNYWSRVETLELNKILKPHGLYCEEYDDYDDDCGDLFSYHIYKL
jgi:hypothetical protein